MPFLSIIVALTSNKTLIIDVVRGAGKGVNAGTSGCPIAIHIHYCAVISLKVKLKCFKMLR